MKVLMLYRGTEPPLAYPTLLDDLAEHGIFVTAADTHRWGILQPNVIARKLRRDEFETLIVTDKKLLHTAQQTVKLLEKQDVPIIEWTENQAVADIEIPTDRQPVAGVCLITDITDARQAVTSLATNAPAGLRLRILGTTKARNIMPVVQLSRKLEVADRVEWLGDDFDLAQQLSECQLFAAGKRPLNHIEASLSAARIPCADIADLSQQKVRDDWQTREFHVKHVVNQLLNLRQS